MAVEKILITVKTYPSPSRKYDELVCTAGFRENGEWVRLYPIPLRKLDFDKQYPKYSWIEVDIEKNQSDPRPESYQIKDYTQIKIVDRIPSDGNSWDARRKIVLTEVHTNLKSLIVAANKHNDLSLATFKPTKMHNFIIKQEKCRTWNSKKLAEIKARAQQIDLFAGQENPFKLVDKVPYKFYYHFGDSLGVQATLMIEDWEIGSLFWKCLSKANGDEQEACKKVKQKYWDIITKKDIHLFLGTTRKYHGWSKNPFVVVGVFWPEYKQPNLLDGLG